MPTHSTRDDLSRRDLARSQPHTPEPPADSTPPGSIQHSVAMEDAWPMGLRPMEGEVREGFHWVRNTSELADSTTHLRLRTRLTYVKEKTRQLTWSPEQMKRLTKAVDAEIQKPVPWSIAALCSNCGDIDLFRGIITTSIPR